MPRRRARQRVEDCPAPIDGLTPLPPPRCQGRSPEARTTAPSRQPTATAAAASATSRSTGISQAMSALRDGGSQQGHSVGRTGGYQGERTGKDRERSCGDTSGDPRVLAARLTRARPRTPALPPHRDALAWTGQRRVPRSPPTGSPPVAGQLSPGCQRVPETPARHSPEPAGSSDSYMISRSV